MDLVPDLQLISLCAKTLLPSPELHFCVAGVRGKLPVVPAGARFAQQIQAYHHMLLFPSFCFSFSSICFIKGRELIVAATRGVCTKAVIQAPARAVLAA